MRSPSPTPSSHVQTHTDTHSHAGGHRAPRPGQLGCSLPLRPPMTHIPARQAAHSLLSAPRPQTLAQSSLPGTSPSLVSWPGLPAWQLSPTGRPRRGLLPLQSTGLLSLIARLLSKPALNGCLFTARSRARCILGSTAPTSACWGPASSRGTELEGLVRPKSLESLPGASQRLPQACKELFFSHTLSSASPVAVTNLARQGLLLFSFS